MSLFTKNSSLHNQVVVITGASSGIGKATALHLASSGAQLILLARKPNPLDDTRREVESLGGKATALKLDVTDATRCKEIVSEILPGFFCASTF